MMAANSDNRILPIAVLLSLLANVVLFSFQPLISRITSSGAELNQLYSHLVPVNILQYTRKPESSTVEKNVKKEPEIIPDNEILTPVVDLDLDFSMPDIAFHINPLLSSGMPVSTPDSSVLQKGNIKNAFSLADIDQAPAPLFQLEPVYPYSAKRSNVTGKVSVMFMVDENGNVSDITILRAVPKGIFEESVRSALLKWKFMPGKLKGKNVSTWVSTNIVFELN